MRLAAKILCGFCAAAAVTYSLAAFTEFPVLSDLRTLWIETAMTTGDHQWLAHLFPQSVIDKVMERQVNSVEGIAGLPTPEEKADYEFLPSCEYHPYSEEDIKGFCDAYFAELERQRLEEERLRREAEERRRKAEEERREAERKKKEAYWSELERTVDPLGQQRAADTGKDKTGRKVIVNDREQGILISKVYGGSYVGRVVQIDDPSRVFIGTTDDKGGYGKLICNYLAEENAVVGINASGFLDYGGEGLGGSVIGRTMAQGETWGAYVPSQITIGFDEQDRLLAGMIDDWEQYSLRDAIQFGPVLIKDGKILTEGSAGWGIQPRTVIAQRSDGVVLFLVIDGRKPGYSIGATMGDCAVILLSYGAMTAAACDGGSSSVLAYNGELLNVPSTPMETGRYLPNAFLVRRKQT